MTRIIVKSRVDGDGVLRLQLPLGLAEADKEVQVIVETAANQAAALDDMRQWVMSTAGKWQGEFERPEQGECEERE